MDKVQRVLANDPANAAVLHSLGVNLRDKRDPNRAKLWITRAVCLAPNNTTYLADWLYTMHFVGDNSVIPQLQALAVSATSPHPARLLALLYAELRRPNEANQESCRSIALDPTSFVSYSKRAVTLVMTGDRIQAKRCLSIALILNPKWLEARINYAYLMETDGLYADALELYLAIINDAPTLIEPYFNASICYLALGNFKEGWNLYHHRWSVNSVVSFGNDYRLRQLKSSKPVFNGAAVSRLLIWREQGIGDEIMFASIVGDATQYASKVMMTCDTRLQSLFARSFPDIDVLGNPPVMSESIYDSHISMGDLARLFRSEKHNFIGKSPYLKADQIKVGQFRKTLLQTDKTIIGISWRSINLDNGNERSVPLAELLTMPSLPPLSWVNLQYDFDHHDRAVKSEVMGISQSDFYEFPEVDKMNDLDGVAALISACDIVISIGNSVAHLAGALGKPVIVLVPTAGSWRWMASGAHTPWYSSAEVIRRGPREEWNDVLGRVVSALQTYLR